MNPSHAPTPCGISDDARSQGIYEILETVSDPTSLNNNTTPQGKAAEWLVSVDEAHLCPGEDYTCPRRLVQRYALAVIYFATGGDDWTKCSFSDGNCGNEYPFVNQESFLSGSHECQWAGIDCLVQSMCVTVINFGEIFFG